MIEYHGLCQITHLHEHEGLHSSQIAAALSLDPRTVASWLAQDHYRARKPRVRSRTRDPLQADIVRLLDTYPSRAAQVWQRIRERGFDGGSSIVNASVRSLRPRKQPACLTLAWAPGECAQVDWGAFGSVAVGQTQRRLSFFVMGLCSSRMMDVECTVSQTMEHFLAGHHHALECFGGVPQNVMVDNRKSAVLTHALGQEPLCNPTYGDCASHFGLTIAPCHVGTGHEKGRVDNGVGSVKKNGLAGLDIAPFSALHPAAKPWLHPVAKVRVHGETRPPPAELWHKDTPSLRPLPPHPFALATVSQVRASKPFRLTVETNRTSVPAHLAGPVLPLKASPDRLCLSQGDNLVARHTSSDERPGDFEDPAPPQPLLEQRKQARDHQLFMHSLALAPQAEASDLRLQERRLTPCHHVRTIVALRDLYGTEAVARALDAAWVTEAFASDDLANLLAQRARCTPEARALPLTRRADVLEIRLQAPDLSISHATPQPASHQASELEPCLRTPSTSREACRDVTSITI